MARWGKNFKREENRGRGACCLCTFFFSFFSFFLNNVMIDLGTKSCMQLALWHIKNPNSKK